MPDLQATILVPSGDKGQLDVAAARAVRRLRARFAGGVQIASSLVPAVQGWWYDSGRRKQFEAVKRDRGEDVASTEVPPEWDKHYLILVSEKAAEFDTDAQRIREDITAILNACYHGPMVAQYSYFVSIAVASVEFPRGNLKKARRRR